MGGDKRWDQVDQVAALFDKAVHQATLLQGAAQRCNDQSARAMAKLQDLSEKLSGEVAAAVGGKLEAAAKRAADQMAQKWAEADAAAASAAAVYRHAESRFTWKLVACIGSGVVAVGAVLGGLIIYLKPVEAELHALREERRLLVADIERLRRMGAGLDVVTCEYGRGVRPCVRVDPDSPTYNGGYKLLPGK